MFRLRNSGVIRRHCVSTIPCCIGLIACCILLLAGCPDQGVFREFETTDTRAPAYPVRATQFESVHNGDLIIYSLLVTNPNYEAVQATLEMNVDNPVYNINGKLLNEDDDSTFQLAPLGDAGDRKLVTVIFTKPEEESEVSRTITLFTSDGAGNRHRRSVNASFAPDLIVTEVTVSPNSVKPNARFLLKVTVENVGHITPANNFTLTVYRAVPTQPSYIATPTDQNVRAISINRIAPGNKESYRISLNAPAEEGVFYYGVCISGYIPEVSKTNNCSSVATLETDSTVLPPSLPDFTIDSFESIPSSTIDLENVPPGQTFQVQTTVRNTGSASGSGDLVHVRSRNRAVSLSNPQEGTLQSIDQLASGTVSTTYMSTFTAPVTGGTYYYGACVKDVDGEIEIDNNCSANPIRITVRAPDVKVMLGDTRFEGRMLQQFSTVLTVQNKGNVALSAGAVWKAVSSRNSAISLGGTSDDSVVGSANSLGEIAVRDNSAVVFSLPTQKKVGTYYYGACVEYTFPPDSGVATTVCSDSVRVDITNPFLGTWTGESLGVTATNSYFAAPPANSNADGTFRTVFNPPVVAANDWTCEIEYTAFDRYTLSKCTGRGGYKHEVAGGSKFEFKSNDTLVVTTSQNRTTTFTRQR